MFTSSGNGGACFDGLGYPGVEGLLACGEFSASSFSVNG